MEPNREATVKAIKFMLAITGMDVITPEPLAKPFIDKVEDSDDWANLQIAVGNADEKCRGALILASAIKFLKHSELLDLSTAISTHLNQLIEYTKDNPDCRVEPDKDAILKMIDGDAEI